MAAIGTVIRVGALIVMYFISNPTILKLRKAEESETLRMRVFDKKEFNYKQQITATGGPQSNEPIQGGRS